MIRTIIEIDQSKCNGCGLCAGACHEGAIGMAGGKATLLRDDYCDGLGNCLPVCPTGAIRFVEREAAAYDEAAVKENMKKAIKVSMATPPCGCPGSKSQSIHRKPAEGGNDIKASLPKTQDSNLGSQLSQWPVQIKLAPVNAGYFDGANLLIAADCSAYAYGNFHNDFIKGKVTLIGCPKLDETDYSVKLTEIIRNNNIKSVTVVRMEVPCCGGIEQATISALKESGKFIPWQVVTISTDGRVIKYPQHR